MPKLPKLCRNPVQCAVAQAAAGVDWALCLAYTHRASVICRQQLSDTKCAGSSKYKVTFPVINKVFRKRMRNS